jgi:hypothetical protein
VASFFCSLSVFSLLPFFASQTLSSKLSSFCANVLSLFYSFIFILLTQFQRPLSISSDDHIHHQLIGTFLLCLPLRSLTSKIAITFILDHACLSYASPSKPALDKALDQAYSQYLAYIHHEVIRHFPEPLIEYSISQFAAFILDHRLCL